MFDKILLAVDGSEHSRKAAGVAGEIGRAFGSEVLVLHVRADELTWAMDVVLETEGEASELVDAIVRELKDAGGSVRGRLSVPPSPTPPGPSSTWRRRKARGSRHGHPRALGLGSAARRERCPQGRPPRRPPRADRAVRAEAASSTSEDQLSPGSSADGATHHRAHRLVHEHGQQLRPRRHGSRCRPRGVPGR
jgi:hypothetical protein